jgi:hypothetical protein
MEGATGPARPAGRVRAGGRGREQSGPVPARAAGGGALNIRMTQDRYLGRKLTDRQTAEVLEGLFDEEPDKPKRDPKVTRDLDEEEKPSA